MIIRMLQLLMISIVDGWILEMLKTVVWRLPEGTGERTLSGDYLREPERETYLETT